MSTKDKTVQILIETRPYLFTTVPSTVLHSFCSVLISKRSFDITDKGSTVYPDEFGEWCVSRASASGLFMCNPNIKHIVKYLLTLLFNKKD